MSSRTSRRKIWVALLGVLVVAALVAGAWVAALFFVSPQQRAAAAAPPPAQPIVATVTRGDLVDSRVLPAEIASASVESLPVLAQSGQTRTVVTKIFAKLGSRVSAGTVLVETNGAPVFLLSSPFPFYRDIGVGDTGPDVQALQDNLVHLSLLQIADGKFGARTAMAVERLYDRAGYIAPRRTPSVSSSTQSTNAPGSSSATSSDASTTPPAMQPFVPLSTLLAAQRLPAVVQTIPAEGTIVTDQTTITVGAQAAQVTATVPDTLVQQIHSGLDAQITMPDGSQIPAIIDQVQTLPSDNSTQTRAILRRADGKPLDPALVGRPVSVQITVATIAKNVLIVPLIALSKHGDGDSVVLVKAKDGTFVQTGVKVVATLGGSAAVDAGNLLKVGDEVRVG